MTTTTRSSSSGVVGDTSHFVYVQSKEHAWIPARLVDSSSSNDKKSDDKDNDPYMATVSIPQFTDEQAMMQAAATSPKGSRKQQRLEKVSLRDYPNHALPLQNVDAQGRLLPVEDMVDLPFLHEAAILYNLKWRHVQKLPYTRTGDIIIACNPYQWLHHLYNDATRNRYAQVLVWQQDQFVSSPSQHNNIDNDTKQQQQHNPASGLEPHVYETSALAYRGLAIDGQDQSILVSGESGAGKTETVKICLNHIASIQQLPFAAASSSSSSSNKAAATTTTTGADEVTSPIVQRVLDSNPLLEAFGNAKTVRNDNSSRFGKYLQLQFDVEDVVDAAYRGGDLPRCVLAGSKCEVYLLEKSRVVTHEPDERTYHIFYQLLAAPESVKTQFWSGLAETDNESFCYVGYTDTDTIEGVSDADRFERTCQALALLDIDKEKLRTLMRTLCVVLQLGNLLFEPDEKDENKTVISPTEDLQDIAQLLLGSPDEKDDENHDANIDDHVAFLRASLTIRTMRARNEEFKVPLNAVQAKDSCDAFAKEIYAKTFLWLVRSINEATCAENNYEPHLQNESNKKKKNGDFGIIGLLDIFGFESFEINRFEQLCINYANEKLQQKFTQDIFRSVQAEYEYEGIELGEITYDDNTDVLDLVEGRMGLLAVLNEECVRPGGSDTAFVSKVEAVNKEVECFVRHKSFDAYQFAVVHYAGMVVYNATNFVTKNMDTLPTDLQLCARQSTNSIIANELGRKNEDDDENNNNKNGDTSSSSKDASDANAAAPAGGGKKKRPPARRPAAASKPSAAAAASKAKPASNGGTSGGGGGGSDRGLARRKSGNLIAGTVWSKFKDQLTTLMISLKRTRTRYIRCIKPNQLKEPLMMDHKSTLKQLRCAGVVAAITISRSAFPNRLDHGTVLDRFRALWPMGGQVLAEQEATQTAGSDDPDAITRFMTESLLATALKSLETVKEEEKKDGEGKENDDASSSNQKIVRAFVLGKTRAYFRAGALEFIENERLKKLGGLAVEIQRMGRGFMAKSRYLRLRRVAIHVESLVRMLLARSHYLRMWKAAVLLQCWMRCIKAGRTLVNLFRERNAIRIQSHWRMVAAVTKFRLHRSAAVRIQTMSRGAIQRPKFREALHQKREEAKLENQVMALQRKLEEAEARRVEAERMAEEKARQAIEEYRESSMEEKKEAGQSPGRAADAASASGEGGKGGAPVASISVGGANASRAEDTHASEQQHTLIDESGKMLEYLRKEVFKLRSQNAQMRTDFDLLKDNNQRLMDANASAGASFAALNQHAKRLKAANEKMRGELSGYKEQVQKMNVVQVELKEELKMKQATYVAEVHSRLQYHKALAKISELVQERCRDSRLVEDILNIADACEAEYMSGPTGMSTKPQGGRSLFTTPPPQGGKNDSSLLASFRSFWS